MLLAWRLLTYLPDTNHPPNHSPNRPACFLFTPSFLLAISSCIATHPNVILKLVRFVATKSARTAFCQVANLAGYRNPSTPSISPHTVYLAGCTTRSETDCQQSRLLNGGGIKESNSSTYAVHANEECANGAAAPVYARLIDTNASAKTSVSTDKVATLVTPSVQQGCYSSKLKCNEWSTSKGARSDENCLSPPKLLTRPIL